MQPDPAETARDRLLLRLVLLGLAMFFGGVGFVAMGASLSASRLAEAPLARAMLVTGVDQPVENASPVRVWVPEKPPFVPKGFVADFAAGLRQEFGLDEPARVVVVPDAAGVLAEHLRSGRMPQPGAGETLAGALLDGDTLTLGDTTFRVTGRLDRRVAGLSDVYVVPDDPRWEASPEGVAETKTGWFLRDGFDVKPETRRAWATDPDVSMSGGSTVVSAATWRFLYGGTLLAAVGCALAQVALFAWLAVRRCGWFRPMFRVFRERPVVCAVVHALHWGILFAAYAFAAADPVANTRIGARMYGMFADSSFGTVIAAYEAGDVLLASLWTWLWNFGVGTFGTAMLPSLVIPAFALFKNLLSLGMVGYLVAPLMDGQSAVYVLHSVTVAVEVQAYIYAAVACVLWPVFIVRAALERRAGLLLDGLKVFGSAALLACVVLGVAALYEAVTLIALSGLGR